MGIQKEGHRQTSTVSPIIGRHQLDLMETTTEAMTIYS